MTPERPTDRLFQRNVLKFAAIVAVAGGVAIALLVDMGLTARRGLAQTGDHPCLVDPEDQVYKECVEFAMGECRRFAAPCEP